MSDWKIEEQGSGLVDVQLNGRAWRYDLEDSEEAVRSIVRSPDYGLADSVYLVHYDGYRELLRMPS